MKKKNENKNRNKQKQQKKTCCTTRLSQGVYKRDFCRHVFANPDRYIYIYTQMVTKAAECRLIGQSNPLFIL